MSQGSKKGSRKVTLGVLWGHIWTQKLNIETLPKPYYLPQFHLKMELRGHINSVQDADLVQIPSKAVNSDDFSVLFDSPSGFKGDHWAPKGPQRPLLQQEDIFSNKKTSSSLGRRHSMSSSPRRRHLLFSEEDIARLQTTHIGSKHII